MPPKFSLAERIVSFALEWDREQHDLDEENMSIGVNPKAWWEHKHKMFNGYAMAAALKQAKRVRVKDEETNQYIWAQFEMTEWWRKYEVDDDLYVQADCPVFFMDLEVRRFNNESIHGWYRTVNLACRLEYP